MTTYSAAATVVAVMRNPPKSLTITELGDALLEASSAAAVWDTHVGATLMPVPGSGPDRDAAARDIDEWTARGWKVLTVLDPAYPDLIRAARRPPALLMAAGQLVTDAYSVAIVGSRHASPAGVDFAVSVARGLVDRGVTVVSGLAEGIDTAAMASALEQGGRVVGVIGTGLDNAYPASNRALQAAVAERGLLLSQFLPDFGGALWSFPARNRTMSAYAEVSVIVEADEGSGTRHQAVEAVAHGRRLVLHRRVATGTSWGRALVDHPAVFVADTAGEVIEQLERIAAADHALRSRLAPVSAGTAW